MPVARGPTRRKTKNKSANINVNNVSAAKARVGKCLSKWFFRIGVLALVWICIHLVSYWLLLLYYKLCLLMYNIQVFTIRVDQFHVHQSSAKKSESTNSEDAS